VERWNIDGTASPRLIESKSLNVSCADVQWSLYSTPCCRKLPFIPESTAIITPGSVALLDGGSGIRIGSRILLKKDGSRGLEYMLAASTPYNAETSPEESSSDSEIVNTPTTDGMESAAVLTEYCEEIAHQANLLIICRRRIPKPEIPNKKPEPARNRRRRTRQRRSPSDYPMYHREDSDSDDQDDEADGEGPAFSDTSSLKSAASSDVLRAASDDSESSDGEKGSNEDSGSNNSESDDFDMEANSAASSNGPDSSSSIGGAEEDSDESESSSLLSVPTSESSGDEVHDRLEDAEGGFETDGKYEYPVGIRRQTRAVSKYCDGCDDCQLETWYHCAICRDSNYDLCHQCIRKGEWCYDKKHQLYEEVSSAGVVSLISWKDFVLGQELLVFDTTSTMDKPIFTHSMTESATLHQSAPVIHPTLPLVVWPICAEKFLFADTRTAESSKKRCFSLQPFKATSTKGN